MISLDRFAYGGPDRQAEPAIAVATCEGCGEDICLGDEKVWWNGIYCIHDDWECMAEMLLKHFDMELVEPEDIAEKIGIV